MECIDMNLMARRAWNVATTAAATNSATTATKSAAAGKQWVVTGFSALYDASNKVGLVTVKKGTDSVRYFWVDTTAGARAPLHIQFAEDDWLIGDENEAVSIELAASLASGVTGYISMNGFHIGVR